MNTSELERWIMAINIAESETDELEDFEFLKEWWSGLLLVWSKRKNEEFTLLR